jgi:hypothetical protein
MNINLGKVLVGGLLAGLVLNIGEFLLNDVVLGKQMQDFLARMNLPDPGTSFMIVAVLLTFVAGIVLVFLYALIRPRLGPGPKTAIVAGLIMWFAIYFYCGIVNGMILGVSFNWLLVGLVWGFVQYIVAAIAGAWAYTEA